MGKRTNSYILVVENSAAANLTVISQSYVASRASKPELLMLVSDFKINSRLKNTQRHFQWKMPWNALNEDVYKRNTLPYVQWGIHTLLAAATDLLNIKYKFYGSGGDLIETYN